MALDQRMEMLVQELRIAQETSNVAFARNGMLPLVTLNYTYNMPGLGESWNDSFSMISDRNFEDHRVGLKRRQRPGMLLVMFQQFVRYGFYLSPGLALNQQPQTEVSVFHDQETARRCP